MNEVDVWSDSLRERLVAALVEHTPASPYAETCLQAAIAETVSRPGKMVRGRLAFATARTHGADEVTAAGLATAVEYFHVASLLLDDLPCMDNAATRRGHACLHRVHDDATAILAALAFINRAYALAGRAFAAQPVDVRAQAQDCLDACLGSAGLVGGQALDLRFGASDRSAREVSRIGRAKTGAMFWLGLLLPALLTHPLPAERRAIEALCLYWGLAFQALDDLLDVFVTSIDAGKTTGRDHALSRPNLAIALGVPAARRRMTRLLGQADGAIETLVGVRSGWSFLTQFQRHFSARAERIAGNMTEVAA